MLVTTVLSGRRALVALLAAVLAVVGAVAVAPAASAHDELYEVEPGARMVVTTPPTYVRMVFGAAPMAMGTIIRVTGPKGVVSTGPATVEGITVTQPLTGGLVPGTYRVDWRVTASDGHPVSGTYSWTLGTPQATSSATPTAGGATASPSTASPSTASPSTSSTAGSRDSGSGLNAGLVAGIAALVVVGAVSGIVILRRRHGGATSSEGNRP